MAGHPVNRRALWHVTVRTTEEAGDAATSLLERLFGETPSTYTDARTRRTTASVYVSARLSAVRRAELFNGLAFIKRCGLNTGRITLRCVRLQRENWSESWKKHFKPIEIGPALLIKPSWSRRRPRRKQAVVILDPGLSFGTGQHPTTCFCLQQLVEARRDGHSQSCMDIGTGSGILAIAAARLGYAPVKGFDFDSLAVRMAQKNARRNGVKRVVSITHRNLVKLPDRSRERFDVVCANLTDDLLVAESCKIAMRLKPGGRLVLAGVLAMQFARVREAFERHGLKMVICCLEGEWRSGAFESVPTGSEPR